MYSKNLSSGRGFIPSSSWRGTRRSVFRSRWFETILLFVLILWHLPLQTRFQFTRKGTQDGIWHEIHVLFHSRSYRANTLLQNILSSYFMPDHIVDLHIHVDRNTRNPPLSEYLLNISNSIQWNFGEKYVHTPVFHKGLKKSWLDISPNCNVVQTLSIFEDDMVVHPMWYAWDQSIRSSLHKIKQEHSILGVSLTPLVKDELHFPFKDWDINALGSVYLHQVPSSWAPVFSCQAWASFRSNYALHRMNKVFEYDHNEGGTTMEGSHAGDPNFDIAGLHSNWWSNSWKRYMVEYALMTGKFFVYPNFPELQGVAKMAHVDSGEHIFTKNSPFQSDLHANPMQLIALEKNLAAFDLNFNPIRLNDAIEVGVRFQNHLHAKGGPYSQLVELLGHSNEEYSPRKFFMYAPEFGLNNQIVTLAIAVKLSTVLNRTLIIPHIFCPRREQTSVAMDDSYLEITEFLDISRALEKYKLKYVILTRGNLEYYRPNNIIELEQQSMFDSRKEIYFSGLRRYSIPRQDFMDHVTNISDKIIFVDNLYFGNVFFDQEELSDIRRNLLKPNTRLSRIQRMIEQQLSLYPKVCIHLRFTDFEKVCSSFMTTVNPFYKRMREDGFSCMPSDHQIQSLIEESLVRGKTFLMTDDPNRLNGILRGVPRKSLVTSEDIQHELERILIHATKHKLSAFQSFVEQQICKRANLAILNRLSTFSISIDILRNHSGVVWQGEDLFKNHQMLLP